VHDPRNNNKGEHEANASRGHEETSKKRWSNGGKRKSSEKRQLKNQKRDLNVKGTSHESPYVGKTHYM